MRTSSPSPSFSRPIRNGSPVRGELVEPQRCPRPRARTGRGLVGLGEAPRPPLEQLAPAPGAVPLLEELEHAVVPRAGDLDHLALELVEQDRRDLALRDVHREVEVRELALGRATGGSRSMVPWKRSRNSSCSCWRTSALNRSRGIATRSETLRSYRSRRTNSRMSLRLLQVEQPHHLVAELLRRRGEQLVLREALEDRDDRLVVVRALEQVLRLQDLLQLAVQERRVARPAPCTPST